MANSQRRFIPILLTLILSVILSPMYQPVITQAAYPPGTFLPVTLTDKTPFIPLTNPTAGTFNSRYLSGFGLEDSFTVFFEDRDSSSTISFVSTTTGPEGFPASISTTNITDTHFVVKDWPYLLDTTWYSYRAWGAVGNNPDHNFYVSNGLLNWTLVSTFTIPNASGFSPEEVFITASMM